MPVSKRARWTGWIISILVSLMFVMSGVMKFAGGKQLEEGMAHLGVPVSILFALGVLELACVVIYLIPMTAVLGAILMTGYVGGAIMTHWRVGDPVHVPIILGIAIWVGLYLREDRLRELLPLIRRRSIDRGNG